MDQITNERLEAIEERVHGLDRAEVDLQEDLELFKAGTVRELKILYHHLRESDSHVEELIRQLNRRVREEMDKELDNLYGDYNDGIALLAGQTLDGDHEQPGIVALFKKQKELIERHNALVSLLGTMLPSTAEFLVSQIDKRAGGHDANGGAADQGLAHPDAGEERNESGK